MVIIDNYSLFVSIINKVSDRRINQLARENAFSEKLSIYMLLNLVTVI